MAGTVLYGSEVARDSGPTFQVYDLTHDKDALSRSFISFSYGGRNIEEFNLIATFNGSRMSRNAYAEFSDIATKSDVLDGQKYWDTHYGVNSLQISLATDGMTQQQLDDFKAWFAPGVKRELILTEHPNRKIMARIGNVPAITVIPFEYTERVKILNKERDIPTILYRGEINFSFIMDDPFWEAITNVFRREPSDGDSYQPVWGDMIPAYSNKYQMTVDKITLEDRIPCLEMVTGANISLGQSIKVREGNEDKYYNFFNVNPRTLVADVDDPNSPYARIDQDDNEATITSLDGRVGPMLGNIDNFPYYGKLYFFYAGTAPSKPIIKFSLLPMVNKVNGFITGPHNNMWWESENQGENTYKWHINHQYVQLRSDTPIYEDNKLQKLLRKLDKSVIVYIIDNENGSDATFNIDTLYGVIAIDNNLQYFYVPAEFAQALNFEQTVGYESWVESQQQQYVVNYEGRKLVDISVEESFNMEDFQTGYPTGPGTTTEETDEVPAAEEEPLIEEPASDMPAVQYSTEQSSDNHGPEYNTIWISENTPENYKYIKFSLPSIWVGYNQVIKILNNSFGKSITDIRENIRKGVCHYLPRKFALYIIRNYSEDTVFDYEEIAKVRIWMKAFLGISDNSADDSDPYEYPSSEYKAEFEFNFMTGDMRGTFRYQKGGSQEYYNDNGVRTVTESVGDMIRLSDPVIEDRNQFDENGCISYDPEFHPEYSHAIWHDYYNGLGDFQIIYKNMYL